jgi:hypothetical protein
MMEKLGIRCIVLLLSFVALLPGLGSGNGSRASARLPRKQHVEPAGGRLCRSGHADDPERGDVPGWVMITLMSAVLVAALLALAGPALEAMFNQAMDKVGS